MENKLKIKEYQMRKEYDLDGKACYILSFGQSVHIKVSEKTMEIIGLMNGQHDKKEIVQILNGKGIAITLKDLEHFIMQFLLPRNVLVGKESKIIDTDQRKLWFHLPLIESSKFSFLYQIFQFLIHKTVAIAALSIVTFCIISSAILLLNDKGSFIEEINSLQILILVYMSMFVHELGHATAAYKYGVKVGKMGIGIYLIYFIFFIDMTNTWRLDRKKRIVNDLSGIYFQLLVIIPIFIGYVFSGNTSLLCSVIVVLSISMMNLVPFLKMDGYWLLTDFLNMQNVQVRAFQSVRNLAGKIMVMVRQKKKGHPYEIDRKTVFYGIYSSVYLLATGITLLFISISFVKLVIERESVLAKFVSLYSNLVQGNIQEFLVDLNNTFVLILPVIFVISILISIFNKIMIKGRCV